MKDMQCSEAESTANHPAFSAPGLTRLRAACCVVALAFLLSNPRWLSNICFQIGFRLEIFAFKSAWFVKMTCTRHKHIVKTNISSQS